MTPGGDALYLQACVVSASAAYRSTTTLTPKVNFRWIATITTYMADVAAPTVTTSGGSLDYTENAAPQPIDPGLTIADADSADLTGATVSISTSLQVGQDVLGFADQGGITGRYDGGTGVLTLTGTASVANYQTALRSVTYANTSEAPNTAARTVSFQVADDTLTASNTATGQIAITAVNDPPVNTIPGAQGTLTFGVNETTETITIPIVADALVEGHETFTVTLSGPTGGATLGQQATIAATIVDTTHAAAPPHPGDDSVEGDVVEVRCDLAWPRILVANRDGIVEVRLIKEAVGACHSIRVGDYLEADGEKQHELLFDADSVEVKRRR